MRDIISQHLLIVCRAVNPGIQVIHWCTPAMGSVQHSRKCFQISYFRNGEALYAQ